MLLKTRFYIPPLRRNVVQRPELLQPLNASEGGQLIVVSAPAGYGKTTLISQWLHHSPHTFSWLSLDHHQQTPRIFWRYVISAIHQVQPDCGERSLQLIQNSDDRHSLENALIALLNELDAIPLPSPRDATTLVLDDYHRVATPELNQQLSSFLDHLPPALRLVITSRSTPELGLARRRASNQLIEIDRQQLNFSAADSKRFLQQTMALNLSDEQSRDYSNSADGWIAGLQLIGLSLQHNRQQPPGPTLQRNIGDYLFEEVFTLQDETTRRFLLRSAAVPRFTAGLCNQLTNSQQGQHILQQLDRHNLFLLPLDNHGLWFRYHDLFRRFLRQHFQQLSRDVRRDCHHSAAQWFENNGHLTEALDQWLLAGEWQAASTLLQQLMTSADDIDARLPRWLEQFPPDHPIRQQSSPATPRQELPFGALLTQREQQVLTLVAAGHNNKEIARQLHISLNTLKVHIRNLYGKIGVESRTEILHKLIDEQRPSP